MEPADLEQSALSTPRAAGQGSKASLQDSNPYGPTSPQFPQSHSPQGAPQALPMVFHKHLHRNLSQVELCTNFFLKTQKPGSLPPVYLPTAPRGTHPGSHPVSTPAPAACSPQQVQSALPAKAPQQQECVHCWACGPAPPGQPHLMFPGAHRPWPFRNTPPGSSDPHFLLILQGQAKGQRGIHVRLRAV